MRVLFAVLGPLFVSVAMAAPPAESVLSTELAPPYPDSKVIERRIAREVAWYRRNTLEAYEKVGNHDPAWDAPAREALSAAVQLWSDDPQRPGNEAEHGWQAAKRAVAAGCTDPLVLYVYSRMYALVAYETPAEMARLAQKAAAAMAGSKYPPAFKAIAHLRAAYALADDAGARGSRDHTAAMAEVAAATTDAKAAAADRDAPHQQLLELVAGILQAGGGARKEHFQPILDAFVAAREAGDPILPLLRARFDLDAALEAKGSGSPDERTQKLRDSYLADADRELARAIPLDPLSRALAPTALTLELAQGHGQERMESWFRYGREVDPGNRDLWSAKVQYFSPLWHGSPALMLKTAREAAATKQWAYRFPMELLVAHNTMAGFSGDADAYFANPGPCRDALSVYGPYLEAYPDAVYERSAYALLLARCGDRVNADRQFKRL
ncbi:MAG: hypothetical protein JWN02_2661, partial [Acidobacteria bacterium]|nr:hypothetical protein [Acidobacteriota bacterium]